MLTKNMALLALWAGSSVANASESEERRAVREQAAEFYRVGNFDALDRQHSMYSSFLEQRTSSGAFKMTLFFDGIDVAMREADGPALKQDIDRTLKWATENDASPLAHVLHARALFSYGAYFRGDGFSNTVPPQAWKVYEEFTKKAGNYLIENGRMASKSTSWHAWMLNISRAAGMPKDVVQHLFLTGIAVDSADYRLYQNALEYMLPKWYGNAEVVDSFIDFAVKNAPAAYGPELYARLYSGTEQAQFGRRLYDHSLVDWNKMKEGLSLWSRRFPTPWNKNIFAYHACIAGDKSLANELLGEIGGTPEWPVWQPRAKVTFDTCTRWAADPEAEPKQPKTRPTKEGIRS